MLCDAPSDSGLQARANALLKERGKTIEPPALALILERAKATAAERGGGGKTGDIHVMVNELEKAMAYAGDRSQVTRADAQAVGLHTVQDNIFSLLNAVGNRDPKRALAEADKLLDGDKPDGVAARTFVMLARHLRHIWGAKYLADQRLNGFNIKGGLPPEVQAVLSGEMLGITQRQSFLAQRLARTGAGLVVSRFERRLAPRSGKRPRDEKHLRRQDARCVRACRRSCLESEAFGGRTMPTFLTMGGRDKSRPYARSFAREVGGLLFKSPTVQGGLLFFLFLLLPISLRAAPTITINALPAPHLAAYGLAEWAVTLNQNYANPFDPDEIAVDATFTGPHGQTLRLPAFWYQDFRRPDNRDGSESLTAAGKPEWRVRFCPPTPGRWRLVVTARDASGMGTSSASAFSVLPSKLPGFVHRAPNNSRYLQYDNGSAFFPIGENICWSGKAGLQDYDAWFPSLSKVGGNYARLWLANRPLEHGPNGLGRYDLENAWYFDQVFALAAKNGIRCMTALGTYGEFTTGGYFGEGQWPVNPYNKVKGGPAASPADFWTDATARAFYRRRLRYLIARYGPETSLAFWEFWNETAAPGPVGARNGGLSQSQ